MHNPLRAWWRNLTQSLGFVPGFVIAVFIVLGIVMVEVDKTLGLESEWVFHGDGSAARTVLSVIAGSLITVAGLTFSITMVVLQLASSQFSPRILRTFFGDRITQLTIGIYVGTFAYALLVLRAVGSLGDSGFVPRLSVTLATLMGIGAVVLLVVFLHHVSQLIQVSHVSAAIAHETLHRTDVLYPERYGEPQDDADGAAGEGDAGDDDGILDAWRARTPGRVLADRPGYVQRVSVDGLAESAGAQVERMALLVCPGDFVGVETPIAEVWPPEATDDARGRVLAAVAIADERDLDQDVEFGIRQLADTALRAISPGINDPMTAVTCISYIRSILVRLTERATPSAVREFPDQGVVVHVRHRTYEEHLDSLLQINRYVEGDAWVATELLATLQSCARAALELGAGERMRVAHAVATTIAEQAFEQVTTERDRARVESAMSAFGVSGAA